MPPTKQAIGVDRLVDSPAAPSQAQSQAQAQAQAHAVSPAHAEGTDGGQRAARPGSRTKRNSMRRALSRGGFYTLVRLGHALARPLPLPVGRLLGRFGGMVAYCIARKERRIAFANLTRVYGATRTEREIARLVRAVFQNVGMTLVEWAILTGWSRRKVEQRFADVGRVVAQLERDVRSTGRGVVGLTGHFGNWELLAYFCSIFSPGLITPVAKRAKSSRLQEFIHGLRSRGGAEILYTDTSPRRMLRILDEPGRVVAFLPDQDVRTNSGVFVDFFGQPAHTVTFPVGLARKKRARMFCCGMVREGKGFRFLYDGLFDVPRTNDEERDLREGTQLWTSHMESLIRAYPEQWLWIYPRWRSTPENRRCYAAPQE